MRPSLVVRRAADYLAGHHVESPTPTAEVLLANVLETDRVGLYTRDAELSAEEARRFGRALCRRCAGVPLQHLTGEQGFRRLTLEVRPGVFIPRPETEIVVERALRAIAHVDQPLVVDVGTGTGAIALAIKDERRDARVFAIDVSPEAVALAAANADRSGLSIDVVEGDLLEPLPNSLRGAVDLVVSNPPYVAEAAYGSLSREVQTEPYQAIIGDIELSERLFIECRAVLRGGGSAVVEIEESRADEICAAASAAGFVGIEVARDLAGRDRVITARVPR